MKPNIARSRFLFLLRRTGVSLAAQERREAYRAFCFLEAMIARVHTGQPGEAMQSGTGP